MKTRRPLGLLLAALLLTATTGCLGTFVEAPSRSTTSYAEMRVHLIGAPTLIRAAECRNGLAEVNTYVPLWGLAVGILSFGIIVPEWTVYSCAVP